MNPNLSRLQSYPFEKLRRLLEDVVPPKEFTPIQLSIGEPQHLTPRFIGEKLTAHLDGLSVYPATLGSPELRESIATWLSWRYKLPPLNSATQIIPVNGTREALFAIAQCVVDGHRPNARVLCPNPFYQIYEGAALLSGASPVFVNHLPEDGFASNFDALPPETLADAQLVYVCSPGNPTGRTLRLEEWKRLFELSDKYDFVIAADECYAEIHFDDEAPPLGALEAAHKLGRHGYRNIVMFTSLSKRSNVPGLRSGFVAGDARILENFLLYRTYQGCQMNPAVQAASAAAWANETHVAENRHLYRDKFNRVVPMLKCLNAQRPEAGFYIWARTPKSIPDTDFARRLYAEYNVTVLPGSFLAREANGVNPGAGFVRIALVATYDECVKAAERIVAFCQKL
ncbi:MAG: succinyldiaminopimelate transaminase [Azoarcus sp.]|jgi:N-succinyldiaminopimelate aminotransferase|nr:succinyldiaminopimelate transaminase [Azoarcus sp.]